VNTAVRALIKFAVGLGIVVALLKFIPYQQVIAVARHSNKQLVLLALAISFFPYLIGVFRWQVLLKAQGLSFSFRELSLPYFCGLFLNLFFPSFVAADIFRGMTLSAQRSQRRRIFSSVVMDRFSGLAGMSLLALGAYVLGSDIVSSTHIFFPLAVFLGFTVFLSLIIFSRRFFHFFMRIGPKSWSLTGKIKEMHDQMYLFKKVPRLFFKSLFYSMVIQSVSLAYIFILFGAVGVRISFVAVVIIVPIVLAIAAIPVTVSGLGTREAAFVYFFLKAGVAQEASLAVSLLVAVFAVVVALIGGVLYVGVYHRQPRSPKADNRGQKTEVRGQTTESE